MRFVLVILFCLTLSCSSSPPSAEAAGATVWGEIDWGAGAPTGGSGGRAPEAIAAAGGALEAQAGAPGGSGGRVLEGMAGTGGALEAQAGASPGGSGGRILEGAAGAGGALEAQAGASPGGTSGSLTLAELAAAHVPTGFAPITETRQAFSNPEEWLTLLFLVEPARCYQIAAAVETGVLELAFYADGIELVSASGNLLPVCYAWTGEPRLIEARARSSQPSLVAYLVIAK